MVNKNEIVKYGSRWVVVKKLNSNSYQCVSKTGIGTGLDAEQAIDSAIKVGGGIDSDYVFRTKKAAADAFGLDDE